MAFQMLFWALSYKVDLLIELFKNIHFFIFHMWNVFWGKYWILIIKLAYTISNITLDL